MGNGIVKFTETQLQARRPVWEALSSLYLDNDVSLERDWRARTLASSPYTLKEIETILWNEVHPVCCLNLFQVAGEWCGFDLEWLERTICDRKPSRFPAPILFCMARAAMHYLPESEWRKTRAAMALMYAQSE